jgi:hypothetical protein
MLVRKKIIRVIKFNEPYNRPYNLFKNEYNSIMPLKIYQTWYTKNLPPKMSENVENLKKQNPRFEHYLFDDNDCREFIKNNFKRTNKAFILQEQINYIIKNEIQINMASAISILLDNELLCISAVNPNGELVYKLTETGFDAVKLLNNETNKE